MRKLITPLILCGILLNCFGNLIAQTYQVQLAAFTEEIDPSFFSYTGYENVYVDRDHNNFTRYTLGEFFTEEAAKQAVDLAIGRGFLNTHIIKLDQPLFAYNEDGPSLPLMMVPEKEELYILSISFEAEELGLTKQLMTSLENALVVMKDNPDLKLRIVGHTDGIGEKKKNKAVSKNRARIIQNFLLANDIPAYRIKMKVSDEPSPEIYFKGSGLPKNRDFNRRIILTLVDLKDEIVVDNFRFKENKEQVLSTRLSMRKILKFVTIA